MNKKEKDKIIMRDEYELLLCAGFDHTWNISFIWTDIGTCF